MFLVHDATRMLRLAAFGLFTAVTAAAQNGPGRDALFRAMPSVLARQSAALGERIRFPGKEKTVFAGQYVDSSGNRAARVTYQTPGLVRLEGFKPGSANITFDGERSYGVTAPADDAFLETFIADTAEGMLASARGGAAIRLLGRRFQPDRKSFPKYDGPAYDVYEVVMPVHSRREQPVKLKRYYFDSKTGWLLRTQYRDGSGSPGTSVEIRFSAWRTLDGSAYPGRIDRYENGQPVFSFVVANISVGPSVEPEAFR